ncbi:MAG: TM0996/MTH895 family glutaredoxin-like protein [Phaeodactylibacter sp.]|nr:TM0996/MTH895 family glutaredoxin-like protein [Phaeodactylibacter sp.]MCB9300832.1 TM0996/MTH895 family glutaredoxin-like protein [Lewinellaceae bacterium]
MKNIKILGPGCPKCKRTEALVLKALEELGVEAKVEKVEDMQQILAYNILSTPAVVIDEEVRIKGRIPSLEELKAILN